ncbi:MAG: outer membrane lipoprotein-sorting protein [Chitinispirillaceae bacterium]|nr:outer membrane lipoprotein-sorting protein [Chitinispirillaceae bacterium]
MKSREKFLDVLSGVVVNHPGKILTGCAILTVVMLAATSRLSMKTQFAEMMPRDIPQVNEYLEIIEDYSSDATVMITIENTGKDTKLMQKAADDLASRLQKIYRLKPADNARLSLKHKIALLKGKHPDGISYDTLNLVKRVDYKLDNEFLSEHGLIIQKPKDLDNTISMFSSLLLPDLIGNINNNFEKEFIEDADNLTTLDGEAQAVQGLEGIRRLLQSLELYIDKGDSGAAVGAVTDFIAGPQYYFSSDNTVLLMMLQPSVSYNEFEDLMYLGYRIDDSLNVVSKHYPDCNFSRTGLMMMQIDENNVLARDFSWPSVIALGVILILLIGSFREWKSPFFSVITLVVGIIWTAGILALLFRYLNMMSAGFGIVLIGLGIDFGIHFISGFRNGRDMGKSVKDSIIYMYKRVGAGVITGALTTAIVFLSLPLTGFGAYSQMGIAMGLGIIITLITQMIMLPAMIVWDNKGYSIVENFLIKCQMGFIVSTWKLLTKPLGAFFRHPIFSILHRPFQFGFLATSGRFLGKVPVAISVLLVATVLVILSFRGAREMKWEYDLMELQPKGTRSQITQKTILDKFELSPDFALVKARSLDECRKLTEKLKKTGNRTGLIGSVDAITEFLPDESVQRSNVAAIGAFRERIINKSPTVSLIAADVQKLNRELVRLHQNIVEIGEMSVMSKGENNKIIRKCDQIAGRDDNDSYILSIAGRLDSATVNLSRLNDYQKIADGVLKTRLISMTGTDLVTFDNLPDDIKKRYVNQRNGDLLINVFPKGYIWNEKSLKNFNEQTMKVSERITGMPVITQLLMKLMAEKGRDATLMGAIAILLFLLIDFRSFKYTLLSAIPLAMGTIWMLGLMAASGMKLSMMNFMALPLIIGIGIDDGVHILHRYRIEGKGSIPVVMKFTGRAILLTSLTTMIGFGSMALGNHTGMAMFGMTLFYGVGACFISSAYVLPAIITLWEKFFNKKNAKGNNNCKLVKKEDTMVKISVLILAITVCGFAITVDEILDKAEANQTPKTSRTEMTQKVYESDGRENISKLMSYSADKGEKSLMEYIEPARIKGMKILMLNDGDDIWFYSPRTARVRKIASHQKNQSINNSDFSYEDMSTKDMREDYDIKLDGEEKKNGAECYKLVAMPKKDGSSYSKFINWIDKKKFIPVEVHYFDDGNTLWKKLTVEGAKLIGNYWSFEKIVMQNLLKGTRTVMEMNKTENDIELDKEMFSERYLSR